MFNVFKKSQEELIKEIHTSFHTEVDRLVAEAKNPIEEPSTPNRSKAGYLRSLGFYQAKTVKVHEDEDRLRAEAKAINLDKQHLVKAVSYFAQRYPFQKFITEDSVKTLCKKYNLIYGGVEKYVGSVPNKNIEEMKKFTLLEDDKMVRETMNGYTMEIVSKEQAERDMLRRGEEYKDSYNIHISQFRQPRMRYTDIGFEIVAPVTDFDTRGMNLTDFQLTDKIVEDPIVLQPVWFENKKHYLIVTAWGLEASDELVVNEKMN